MNEPPRKSVKSWQEQVKAIAVRALGEQSGIALWQHYHEHFPAEYQLLISPRYALNDMLQLEQAKKTQRPGLSLIRRNQQQKDFRLHFYSLQERYLDEFIPVLENVSLRVIDQVQFIFHIGSAWKKALKGMDE